MPRQRKTGDWRLRPAWLLLAVVALANGGCLLVAAGAAAGGAAAGYYYFKGKVCQDYPASFSDTWKAVQGGLHTLGLPLVANENDGKSGTITSRAADGSTITIVLDVIPSRIPAEGTLTRVCVRVGTFGDQAVSERILSHVSAHLVPAPPGGSPVTSGPPAGQWTSVPGAPPGPLRPVPAAPGVSETAEPQVLPKEPVPVPARSTPPAASRPTAPPPQ